MYPYAYALDYPLVYTHAYMHVHTLAKERQGLKCSAKISTFLPARVTFLWMGRGGATCGFAGSSGWGSLFLIGAQTLVRQ